MIKKISEKKELLLFIIGSLLIVIAIFLLFYERIQFVKEQLFTEISALIDAEIMESDDINIDTDYFEEVEDENIEENPSDDDPNQNNNNQTPKPNTNIKKEYIGYLEIPKISLKYGFVAKDSYYNNVNRNIQIIKEADFPDVSGGNFIIAGHSGNAGISYFRNLYLLKEGDIARVTYNSKLYTYKIVNIYKAEKTGSVTIVRDTSKSTLTLITCSYKDKKHQTIYIAELQNVV